MDKAVLVFSHGMLLRNFSIDPLQSRSIKAELAVVPVASWSARFDE
jgi:hypothetical protein